MPTNLPRVQVTLPVKEYQLIKARSKKEKVSMARVIVVAIEAYLKEVK